MLESNKTYQLQEIAFFQSLTEQEQQQINDNSKVFKIKKSDKVYGYGKSKSHVYVVLSGAIKLGVISSNEKVLIKDIVYDGQLFGENIFVDGEERKEFAEALKESHILCIPIQIFKDLALRNAGITLALTDLIVSRIQNLEYRTQNFVFMKAKQRISHFLKSSALARGIKIGIDEVLINHGMSHKEIAFLTDTSRQTVARVLGELKEENVIHFSSRKPNKILIRNMATL